MADSDYEHKRSHKHHHHHRHHHRHKRPKFRSHTDGSDEEPHRHKKLNMDASDEEPHRHKKLHVDAPDDEPIRRKKHRHDELHEELSRQKRDLSEESDKLPNQYKRHQSDESDDESDNDSSRNKKHRSRSREKEKDESKEEKYKKEDKSKNRGSAVEDREKNGEKEKDRKKEKRKEKKKKKESHNKERSRWQNADEDQKSPAQIKQEPGLAQSSANSNLSKFEEKSGKLAEDTNTYNGIVIKYSEPPEARKPKRRWRLYPFKGEQSLPILHIHRQSAFLLGRERRVCDIPIDHPSCSKQHAALQYRLVPFTREDGRRAQRVRLYIIDLESANGTFVNNQRIEPRKYVELLEKDVIKFGFSSREYVLLHEHSKDSEEDDDI